MAIASTHDYRAAAKRRLPPFLFHYIDGGAYDEHTLRRNVDDLRDLALRQRVLKGVGEVDLSTRVLGEELGMPVALAPVGLTGMYWRRGEVAAARAAAGHGVPFTLSTMSICSIEDVAAATSRGGLPSDLARRKATLDWKWPNCGLVAARSSGSVPATAATRELSSEGNDDMPAILARTCDDVGQRSVMNKREAAWPNTSTGIAVPGISFRRRPTRPRSPSTSMMRWTP